MNENQATVYPPDGISGNPHLDVIAPDQARTLDQLFRERVRRSADRVAYTEFDSSSKTWVDRTWAEMAEEVERWQIALNELNIEKGDRVAIHIPNGTLWVACDQACLRLGLVVVPLYVEDRADNASYVLENSGARVLVTETLKEWQAIEQCEETLVGLTTIVVLKAAKALPVNVHLLQEWLPAKGAHLERGLSEADDLASIVYTSGTTGRPKGVMLSHHNMLSNAYAGLRSVPIRPDDVALSFLPLSHTFERTIGYYVDIMAGCRTVYNRSVKKLLKDLQFHRPTTIIAVPRIFERFYSRVMQSIADGSSAKRFLFDWTVSVGWKRFQTMQGRASWSPALLLWPLLDKFVASKIRAILGGKLRFAVIGGAPLPYDVGRLFTSLGLPLMQGYGLTESSPVISVNTEEFNRLDTIGLPLRGVEVCIGEDDELLVRGDNIMLGYWQNDEATAATMTTDGWLKTGDKACFDEGFLKITGRLKDIMVLATGEKVPPADMEQALVSDPIVRQVMIVGEGKPYLSALLVLEPHAWKAFCRANKLASDVDLNEEKVEQLILGQLTDNLKEFPGYAQIRRIHSTLKKWGIEEDLITPTLKLKRLKVAERYAAEIEGLYEGH
ncbi:MAG: long-chain fatty acid--CoA ligase [Proteobacteria bacterium]|jgi:long-chain acyl-CoA synthetase|nr:long-chain fatty acid--CoA ligase [Pseudomonadota bacterium]